jgi:hypothetical protein
VIEHGSRGAVAADLSYLTAGLSWSAEHVLVKRGEREGTWSANVTVQNTTGRDFVDADLRLVAGEPQRAGEPAPLVQRAFAMSAKAAPGADLSEQVFSEYHLYTLDRPATLRDRETQSLSMLEPRAVKLSPRYFYRAGAAGVMSQIEIMNEKEAGLGVPLPGGRVRIYEADASGAFQLAGESSLRHTAAGEKLTLDVGQAFDLAAERRQTSEHRISDHEREYSIEVVLRNHKPQDVAIVVEEPLRGDSEVIAKTHEFVRKDSNTLQFTVPVPAGKEVKLGYTARVRN